jgi:hypothetical protein
MAYLSHVHIDHVAQLVEDRSSFLDPILHIIITNGRYRWSVTRASAQFCIFQGFRTRRNLPRDVLKLMKKILHTLDGGHAWANLVCARDELRERVPYRVVREHQKPRAGVDARQHRLPLDIILGPYHSVCHSPVRTFSIASESIDRCTIHLFMARHFLA